MTYTPDAEILDIARRIGNCAADMDYLAVNIPNGHEIVAVLHDLAMQVAGSRVDEIYAPGD